MKILKKKFLFSLIFFLFFPFFLYKICYIYLISSYIVCFLTYYLLMFVSSIRYGWNLLIFVEVNIVWSEMRRFGLEPIWTSEDTRNAILASLIPGTTAFTAFAVFANDRSVVDWWTVSTIFDFDYLS